MAVTAEEYSILAYTHADARKRPVAEAERQSLAVARKQPGVLSATSHGLTEYRKASDQYLFSLTVVSTQKPY